MASSTLAPIDEEEEDVDQLDAQACKMRFEALRAERDRREEYLERLQEKLKAIGTEVSGRKEEVAEAEEELADSKMETGKRRKDAKSEREEAAKDKSSQENVLQTMVSTLTDQYPEPRSDQSRGIEITSLIVHKSEKPEKPQVDAVLVCFLPTKDAQFFCTFRVDPETKLRQLLKDSCIYWNVSEVDYVLKVAGATLLSSLTVDEAFRTKEPAFVHLVRKNIRSTTWTDLERTSIEPKIGSGLGQGGEEEGDADPKPADKSGEELEKTFEDRLKEFDGWHRHMTLKEHSAEQNARHLPKLRWSFLLLYLLLFCLTVVSFSNRHSTTGIEFWAQETVRRSLCDLPPGTAVPKVIGFDKIRTQEQLWRWLEAGVPAVLLDGASRFRQFNVPVGQLRIAQERMRLDSSACLPAFATAANLTCGPVDPAAPVEKENLWASAQGFETWNASTARDTGDPWRYTSDSPNGLDEINGRLRPYGEMGFYVEYTLDANPADPGQLAAESVRYADDLTQLKASDWIDAQTQAVAVSYTVFNGNWELWVSAAFVLELLPGGGVLPTARVQTFRPSQFQNERLEQSTTLDWARGALIFCGYMFIIYVEVQHKRDRKGGSMLAYVCSIGGVCDLVILGVCLGVHVVRLLGFYDDPIAFLKAIKADGIAVAAGEGDLLHALAMLEAGICVLLLYRLASFFRVVRIVFILWKTMTHAAQMFMTFFILFIPLFCGFVFLSMVAYGTTKQEYAVPNRAATALILMLNGDIDYLDLREPHRMGTTITVVLFAIIFILFLFNVFVALLCRAYQEARVQHGYFPHKYAWSKDDYLKYFFWEKVRYGAWRVKSFLRPEKKEEAADDDGAGVVVDWEQVEA